MKEKEYLLFKIFFMGKETMSVASLPDGNDKKGLHKEVSKDQDRVTETPDQVVDHIVAILKS
ncbi:MAG: hypothetical protein Q8K26_03065, partial [Candidatus Gracilibacteria bacterium]|nr:hypothetical protein [Candidatus Gracilibacteria bacterium]